MEDGDDARRGPRSRPSVLNPRRPTSTMRPGAGGLLGLRAMTESVRVPELAAGRGRSTDCDLLVDPDAVDRLDRALEAAGWEPVTSFAAGSVFGHEAGQGDAEGHAQHGPDRVGGDVHHGGVATGQGELIGLDRHGDPGPEQHPPPARAQHRGCGENGHEQQHVRQVGEHLRGDHRLQVQRPVVSSQARRFARFTAQPSAVSSSTPAPSGYSSSTAQAVHGRIRPRRTGPGSAGRCGTGTPPGLSTPRARPSPPARCGPGSAGRG